MDLVGALGDRINAFSNGIAGLAPPAAILSLTIICLALTFSAAARNFAMEHKQLVGPVIFGLICVPLIPAFVAAIG